MLPDDIDDLSHAELKGLVLKQWEQIVELERLVVALRDEIARLQRAMLEAKVAARSYQAEVHSPRPGATSRLSNARSKKLPAKLPASREFGRFPHRGA
jgi:hypothetical protein